MGSVGEGQPVMGEFIHPVITDNTEHSDPWQRNYFAAPALEQKVPRSYPLIDMRPLLEQADYSPTRMMETHGFAVVKHRSAFLDQLDQDLDEHAFVEKYCAEIKDLVLKVMGAKEATLSTSIFRQGKRVPSEFQVATKMRSLSENESEEDESFHRKRLAKQSDLGMSAPVRVPHTDFTARGARQVIRSRDMKTYEAAVQNGAIAAEDKICEGHPFDATDIEAGSLLAEKYNAGDEPGPRYAAFSIWRPLKTVTRDPLALSPNSLVPKPAGELVYWPYLNKIPGPPELGGDSLQQLAMLGVNTAEPSDEGKDHALKWYYVSAQQPDEVLFIKQFDTAAFGADPPQAGAPWHASPEIGDAAENDEPRESIDVRVIAFW